MRLLCSALLSANLLLGSSFSLLSPYHFLCQDNILPKNIFSFERTFVLSETPAESTPAADSSDVLNLSAPSVLLMEASIGTILYENNSHTVLRPASITKIMTLILIFDAIESGQISLEDTVTVSEYAASMGGSQVFLEPNETQTVDTMIKCISVASANDACVAMAEFICGSEAAFVEKMNERAKGLGMNDTTFVNCCGLDVDGHMTSAYDVALMSRELTTKYPQIHNYSTIWMDTITHVTRRGSEEFGLTNTNKLIRQYQYATGLKTGSTSLAKYCVSATAVKDGMELIAVVMAAPDFKIRFADAATLLNYGFSKCRIYSDENTDTLAALPLKKEFPMKSLSATAPHFSMWLQTVPISPVSQKNWNCRNLWKPRLHPVMSSGALSINWATGNLERSTFYAARILPPLSTKIILWNHCKCTCHKSANYYRNKV